MIAFKNTRALDDWHDAHPMLREVILYMLANAWPSDRDMVVTRIAEPDANQKTAIHTCGPPHRAADFSIRSLPEQTGQRIEEAINKEFRYDGERPKNVAYFHDAGSGNHLHIQVSNNTARKPAA